LKTGFTNASGFNIAISGVRDNRRLIVVVLGGPTRITRDRTAESLLATGFDLMSRRAAGEQITVAQNFFEPPSYGDSTRDDAPMADPAGTKVMLASALPPLRSSKLQILEPRKGSPAGGWTVQVGSFRSRSDAKEQLAIVEKKFSKHFDDARPAAPKDDGKYRARFGGLSEKEARAACQALKAKKQPCMVLPPQG
jgi:D-alanyl-D-alanine carboxypeptidase